MFEYKQTKLALVSSIATGALLTEKASCAHILQGKRKMPIVVKECEWDTFIPRIPAKKRY